MFLNGIKYEKLEKEEDWIWSSMLERFQRLEIKKSSLVSQVNFQIKS